MDLSDSEVSDDKSQEVEASKYGEDPSDSQVIDDKSQDEKKEQNPCEVGNHSVDSVNIKKSIENANGSWDETKFK